jgi:hypothetical protein
VAVRAVKATRAARIFFIVLVSENRSATLVRGAFHAHAIRLLLSKMLSPPGDSGW